MTLWHVKHSYDFTILIWNSYTPTPDCDFVQNRGVPNSPLGPAAEFLLKVHLTVVMLLVILTLCFCLTLASMTWAKQQLSSAHLWRARLPISDVISHLRLFPWRDQELTPINDVRLLANSLHLLCMCVLYTYYTIQYNTMCVLYTCGLCSPSSKQPTWPDTAEGLLRRQCRTLVMRSVGSGGAELSSRSPDFSSVVSFQLSSVGKWSLRQ